MLNVSQEHADGQVGTEEVSATCADGNDSDDPTPVSDDELRRKCQELKQERQQWFKEELIKTYVENYKYEIRLRERIESGELPNNGLVDFAKSAQQVVQQELEEMYAPILQMNVLMS